LNKQRRRYSAASIASMLKGSTLQVKEGGYGMIRR
jgi:hypothetical protein